MLATENIQLIQGTFFQEHIKANLCVGNLGVAKSSFEKLMNLAIPLREMESLLSRFSSEELSMLRN